MSELYPCSYHPENACKYGGNKYYDYGFCGGTAEYCRYAKQWVESLEKCPLPVKTLTPEAPDETAGGKHDD